LARNSWKIMTVAGTFWPKIFEEIYVSDCLIALTPRKRARNIMLGKLGVLGFVVVLVCTTGCTMCCHPYDECGPVFSPNACGDDYCSSARAGSILDGQAPAPESVVAGETIEEGSETIAAAQPSPIVEAEPRRLTAVEPQGAPKAAAPKAKTVRRPIKQTSATSEDPLWQW
jgi:hypothetical protein